MKRSAKFLVNLLISAFLLAGLVATPVIAQDKSKDPKAAPAPQAEKGKNTVKVLLDNNKVQVIRGTGGQVRTITATSVAQKDMLGKIKAGDVLIGMTTPLTVTRIDPVK